MNNLKKLINVNEKLYTIIWLVTILLSVLTVLNVLTDLNDLTALALLPHRSSRFSLLDISSANSNADASQHEDSQRHTQTPPHHYHGL